MKIIDVICSPGRTGFFFDDQKAIKNGAKADGEAYLGSPETDGFTQIRQAGESISVMLLLEDGQIAYGDCCAVQYSGTGGRDPLFLSENYIPFIEKNIAPLLIGQEITQFRTMMNQIENVREGDRKLHTAIGYGMSQALLDAVAKNNKQLMAEVIANEYGSTVSKQAIPIFSQSGDNRYGNVDKMIIKQADVLPHGLINHVETKLGNNGELLFQYINWLRNRITQLRKDTSYQPILHIDVYGTIGIAFDHDFEKIVSYLYKLQKLSLPFKLYIEGVVDMQGREAQMHALAELTSLMERRDMTVKLVADEWCNTLEDVKYFADNKAGHIIQIKTPDLGGVNNTAEAVLYCKEKGILAYQGGTCNETDTSAKVCTHVAMGTCAEQILAKPGMGVDEGYMIVNNEMQRILSFMKTRR